VTVRRAWEQQQQYPGAACAPPAACGGVRGRACPCVCFEIRALLFTPSGGNGSRRWRLGTGRCGPGSESVPPHRRNQRLPVTSLAATGRPQRAVAGTSKALGGSSSNPWAAVGAQPTITTWRRRKVFRRHRQRQAQLDGSPAQSAVPWFSLLWQPCCCSSRCSAHRAPILYGALNARFGTAKFGRMAGQDFSAARSSIPRVREATIPYLIDR
jgi:hypothetical protein